MKKNRLLPVKPHRELARNNMTPGESLIHKVLDHNPGCISVVFRSNSKEIEALSDITGALDLLNTKGYIRKRTPLPKYTKCAYTGNPRYISHKWNVMLYENQRKSQYSLVTNDLLVLADIVGKRVENFVVDNNKRLLLFDDAGWGCPLGGVSIGISDNKQVDIEVVETLFFRPPYDKEKYLEEYTKRGLTLLDRYNGNPAKDRIEICTGYINLHLRIQLRSMGYNVKVVEIEGLLQDNLEDLHGSYVNNLVGQDIYYDPKVLDKSEIARCYNKAVRLGQSRFPELLKTWGKSVDDVYGKRKVDASAYL